MKNKKSKKGFTLVELIVVIAIIAILAAVSVVSYLAFVRQANESADIQLVKQLNTALQGDEVLNGPRSTMHEMLGAMEDNGFVVENLTKTKSGYDIVWDQQNNRFALLDGEKLVYSEESYSKAKKYNVWKFVDTEKEAKDTSAEKYSIYLTDEFAAAEVKALNIGAGLDVGNYSKLEEISYSNSNTTLQDVIIRTNSLDTKIEIDDKSTGSIYHYGVAGVLNIIECHTSSYHEYDVVAFAEISKGRIVLEKGSEIKHIHINANSNKNGFDTVFIEDKGAKTLPDSITRDEVNVSEKTLVVTVVSNGVTEEVYVYANGSTGSTQKVTEGDNKQNENIDTDLAKLVLDDGTGSKALNSTKKDEAKQNAIEKTADIGIKLNPEELILLIDKTQQIVATITTSVNYSYTLEWNSSDPNVASVDKDGVVTGVAEGSATITASVGNKTATCAVTVSSGIQISGKDFNEGPNKTGNYGAQDRWRHTISEPGNYKLVGENNIDNIEGNLMIQGPGNFTIDLNGCELTTSNNYSGASNNGWYCTVYVTGGANVVIKDSSADKSGKITNNLNGQAGYAISIEDSTLTIENGEIQCNYSSCSAISAQNSNIIIGNDAQLINNEGVGVINSTGSLNIGGNEITESGSYDGYNVNVSTSVKYRLLKDYSYNNGYTTMNFPAGTIFDEYILQYRGLSADNTEYLEKITIISFMVSKSTN